MERVWYLPANRCPVVASDGPRPEGVTHWCREGDPAWTPIDRPLPKLPTPRQAALSRPEPTLFWWSARMEAIVERIESLTRRTVKRYARKFPYLADDLTGEARLGMWRACRLFLNRGNDLPRDNFLARCALNAMNRFVAQQFARRGLSAEPASPMDLGHWWDGIPNDEAGPIVRAMFREYLAARDQERPEAAAAPCRSRPPKDLTGDQRDMLKLLVIEMRGETVRTIAAEFERRTGRRINKSLVSHYRSGRVRGTGRWPSRSDL